MSREEIMKWCKEEIERGLRLFGLASGNSTLIKQWIGEYNLTADEVLELQQYNKKLSARPEFQSLGADW